ncbi:MAG TPA: deoxyguanosinetriphosphate triphosphohydrolase [Phycisphaerae bacterium]|nr:deoxyguanosinetriphosphate triphosphohydrolase [Phycisphaerae bacterium]
MPETPLTRYLDCQDRWLAGYALRVADSGGRVHHEGDHPYRTCYQRDRDRIVHCAAFRRLDYKTQVFVPHEQDHFRTRMTHTLEVAQVARSLARALAANEDVAEAAALAHDLGHAPFGHAGEQALDELMADHGHFEHNRQTLRVVDVLEHPYPDFRGLNLTRAVRCCLAKHQTRYDAPSGGEFDDGLRGPLEGQLVDLADEIAYTSADLYDALAVGWIDTDQLDGLALWRRAAEATLTRYPSARPIHLRIQSCRAVLDILAADAIAATAARLEAAAPASPAALRAAGDRVAGFSQELAGAVRQLQDFLLERVYHHDEARRRHEQAGGIIRDLFTAYLADPQRLPPRYARRVESEGPHRVICDYIAGMTDRFCAAEHERIVGVGD